MNAGREGGRLDAGRQVGWTRAGRQAGRETKGWKWKGREVYEQVRAEGEWAEGEWAEGEWEEEAVEMCTGRATRRWGEGRITYHAMP